MPTVQLRKPTEVQAKFINSKKPRIVIRAGRRGGKTTGIGIRAVERFLAGRRVLYAAPTNDQVNTFWAEINLALRELLDAGLLVKNETRHTVAWKNPPVNEKGQVSSARIRAKTAWNADTLRGDFADELILDEFQLMAEDAWGVVGAPMLLDNGGDATFIYTPPSMRSKVISKAEDKMHAAKLFKHAETDTTGRWDAFHFRSHDNPHLDKVALEDITFDMTALAYRQEILAEDIDDIPGSLWTQSMIEANRLNKDKFDYDSLVRVAVAIDPVGSASGHECGIIVGGTTGTERANRTGFVIADYSMNGKPADWAKAALNAAEEWDADCIVIERNYGGDMAASTLRLVAASLGQLCPPVREVVATRGKNVRAEPISGLTEQGRIKWIGQLPELEDQLCSFILGGSNDRVDAFVWLFTFLLGSVIGKRHRPIDDHSLAEYERRLLQSAGSQYPSTYVEQPRQSPTWRVAGAVQQGSTEFSGLYRKVF